jgi:hypothetical protein
MSFDLLKGAAIDGDHERLKEALMGIANTCAADEYGITPLMFAVWNGHVECVKYLVSNDLGVSAQGQKRSSLNMQSGSGYTALHLAALDCPDYAVKEITFILLSMKVDETIKCLLQKTARELAIESENNGFLEVMNRFHNSTPEETELLDNEVDELREKLAASYAFRPEATLFVKPFKANFPVPKFLFQKDRLGSIPYGMIIQEAHLQPLSNTGYEHLRGTNSLHCIEFSLTQSEINEKRREVLVKTFDETWQPRDDGDHITDSILYTNSKIKQRR